MLSRRLKRNNEGQQFQDAQTYYQSKRIGTIGSAVSTYPNLLSQKVRNEANPLMLFNHILFELVYLFRERGILTLMLLVAKLPIQNDAKNMKND